MDTMGVSGLWGLDRLERSGLSTARTSLSVMIVSVTVHGLLFAVFFGGVPDRPVVEVAVFLGIFNGLVLSATLALARWTQADLEDLTRLAPEIEPSLALLRPSRRLVLWCFAYEAVAWVLLFYVGRFGFAPVPIGSVLRFWATLRGFFLGILLPLTAAAIWTPGLVVVIRQVRALAHAARHIEVDILALDRYPRLAAPLARFVVFALLLVSFAPTLAFLNDPREPETLMIAIAMPVLALGMAVLVAAYAHPVWILRGRIGAAKGRELDYVLDSLRGDQRAMSRSRIGGGVRPLSLSELLDYRDFVESLSDWPVGPHLQRILLVGLLPLTTWVLAALIENAVSAFLGSG